MSSSKKLSKTKSSSSKDNNQLDYNIGNNYSDNEILQKWFKSSDTLKNIFNTIIFGLILLFGIYFMFFMHQDINKRYSNERKRQIKVKEQCEKEFRKNGCHKAEVPPALEEY